MRRFEAEKRLIAAQVNIIESRLPAGVRGLCCRMANGREVIVLAPGLSWIERRCTLTHEYYHLRAYMEHVFSFHDTYAGRLVESKLEQAVRAHTADHLVSMRRLMRALRVEGDMAAVAEQMEITLDVLADAIGLFSRRGIPFFSR